MSAEFRRRGRKGDNVQAYVRWYVFTATEQSLSKTGSTACAQVCWHPICMDANKVDDTVIFLIYSASNIYTVFNPRAPLLIIMLPLAAGLLPCHTSTASANHSVSLLFPSNCGRNVGFGAQRSFYICQVSVSCVHACIDLQMINYMCSCVHIRLFVHQLSTRENIWFNSKIDCSATQSIIITD